MDTLDLNTFLIALYTIIDDLYKALFTPALPHPGPQEVMTNSEILFLAICVQWLNLPERKLIRFVQAHWKSYLPRLISQSQYNRRLHALGKILACLVTAASVQLEDYFRDNYEVMDTISVPLMKRCRGKNHRLFPKNIANIGTGGSDKDWYYGIKLALVVNPDGIITGFILSPASTSDRWLAEYLLCYRNDQSDTPVSVKEVPKSHKKENKRVGPTGLIWPKEGVGKPGLVPYLVDLGFSGRWWASHWQKDYGALVYTPDMEMSTEIKRENRANRHLIETINGHLTDEFYLKQSGARSMDGLLSRIGAKLLALNLGIWLNKLFDRPNFAFATLFDW